MQPKPIDIINNLAEALDKDLEKHREALRKTLGQLAGAECGGLEEKRALAYQLNELMKQLGVYFSSDGKSLLRLVVTHNKGTEPSYFAFNAKLGYGKKMHGSKTFPGVSLTRLVKKEGKIGRQIGVR